MSRFRITLSGGYVNRDEAEAVCEQLRALVPEYPGAGKDVVRDAERVQAADRRAGKRLPDTE